MNAKNSIAETVASMRLTTLGLAFASCFLWCSNADAAGLGKLTVLSALGQPLRAEIELTSVSKEDVGSIVSKLASAEAFRQANVALNSTLTGLSFSLETRGMRQFVILTSTQSISEPFLEILVELNSTSGKLIREYTMLLDPVEMQANNAPLSSSNGKTISKTMNSVVPQAAAPEPAAKQLGLPGPPVATNQRTGAVPVVASVPKVNPVTAPPVATAATDKQAASYKIKAGDTLSRIADQYKPAGVSMEQMLVALQRENAAAFIDHNMNLLRSGRILTIPDATKIEQTNQPEAQKIVLAQALDFTSYRNRLATQVQQAAAEKSGVSRKTEGGKITAKVTEAPNAVTESKDKLTLSKAQLAQQADKKVQDEDKIAKQRALDDANARVKELEANTAKLKSILDLKNQATMKAEAAAEAQKTVASGVGGSGSAIASAPVSASAPAASPKPVKVTPKLAVTPPLPVPEVQPGLMDKVIQYLPLGAGVLALLGLVGLWANRRKKKVDHFDDESILTGSSIKTNSLFGSAGGQSVDTNNSVFNSNFAPSASQLDANEVDPVAEADVYIAYGRDEQAEEILKEALRTQPDRQAVRVKLLEIYAHRKDVRTFENVASELYGLTSGEGLDWQQAASLGLIIDPFNPLYASGQGVMHPAVLGAPTLPIESLDPEALLGNSLSKDMLDAINAKRDAAPSMLMGDIGEQSYLDDDMAEGLDFDLGLVASPAPQSAPDAVAVTDAVAQESGLVTEFLPSVPGLTLPSDPVTAPDQIGSPLDFADLDFDFNIPTSNETGSEAIDSTPIYEIDPEIDLPAYQNAPLSAAKAVDYDLSDINFDLPKTSVVDEIELPPLNLDMDVDMNPAVPVTAFSSAVDADEDLEFSAEMATKMDLALAYQEIGDLEGARELLEEVLAGGNREQIVRANAMLRELV